MAYSFTGQLLRPADAGFGDAAVSRIFNQQRRPRRPAAVLRAANAADVAAGVRVRRTEQEGSNAGWRASIACLIRPETRAIGVNPGPGACAHPGLAW